MPLALFHISDLLLLILSQTLSLFALLANILYIFNNSELHTELVQDTRNNEEKLDMILTKLKQRPKLCISKIKGKQGTAPAWHHNSRALEVSARPSELIYMSS